MMKSEIEKHLYIQFHVLSDEDRQFDEAPLNTPSLKRKLDELHMLNFAVPSPTMLHDLVCAFGDQTDLRWLEIERASLPAETLRVLKPSLTVMVDVNQQRLIQHNLTHILFQRSLANGDDNQNILFRATDLSLAVPIEEDHRFNLLTCIGSLNRFFKSKESARQLFKNMASYLAVDGHLVCVFRSGDHLLPPTSKKSRSTPLDLYSPVKDILAAPFGWLAPSSASAITCDTPTGEVLNAYCVQPHQEVAANEYLVFCDAVRRLALDHGLTAVTEYPDSVKQHFSHSSNTTETPFKRFVDTCYIAMVFKK